MKKWCGCCFTRVFARCTRVFSVTTRVFAISNGKLIIFTRILVIFLVVDGYSGDIAGRLLVGNHFS